MGKTLVVIGLLGAAAGLLVMVGVPLGRLPGDVVYRRGGFTVYIPITTSILVSFGLTLILAVIRR